MFSSSPVSGIGTSTAAVGGRIRSNVVRFNGGIPSSTLALLRLRNASSCMAES